MPADRRAALRWLGGTAIGLTGAASGARAITIAPVASGNIVLAFEAAQLTQGGWIRARLEQPGQISNLRLGDAPVRVDEDGRFVAGFDRDAGPVAYLKGTCAGDGPCTADGRPPELAISIAPRDWPIQHVDAPFHPPTLTDEEFARIRTEEIKRIVAARAQVTGAQGWRQDFAWPLKGAISGRFGRQRIYRGTPGSYHSGLDIAGKAGAPFVAPADGVVVLAAEAPFTLEGNLLMIDHGMGLGSAFLHASKLAVKEGEQVRQGQLLGWVGMTGRATGPHLHWAIKWQAARLDPLLFVASTR